MRKKTVRLIEGYEKVGDQLRIEIPLEGASLPFLKDLFKAKDDPMMYYGYEINEEQARILECFIDQKLNLEEFDYFLTCHWEPVENVWEKAWCKFKALFVRYSGKKNKSIREANKHR